MSPTPNETSAQAVEVRFENAQELVGYLRTSGPDWMHVSSLPPRHQWMFRGQSDASWRLVASCFRGVPGGTQSEQRQQLLECLASQYFAVYEFISLADEFGILPFRIAESDFHEYLVGLVRYAKYLGTEIEFDSFSGADSQPYMSMRLDAEECEFLPPLPEQYADALMLAQHHGIETELLDWTRSPLTALFFAALGSFENEKAVGEDFAVWALAEWPIYRTLEILRPSKTDNLFAKSQLGCFSRDPLFILDPPEQFTNTHIVRREFSEEDYGWPFQDKVVERVHEKSLVTYLEPVLRKVVAPKSIAGEVLTLLSIDRVSKAHLMPTLDNVTQTLRLNRELIYGSASEALLNRHKKGSTLSDGKQ